VHGNPLLAFGERRLGSAEKIKMKRKEWKDGKLAERAHLEMASEDLEARRPC
jgi:hypothetical protein